MNESCHTHGWVSNALQHIAILQRRATQCNTVQHSATHGNTLQHSATRCNTLQHTATHCNTLQHTSTHCNTLQHTAIHCNTLQRTATHCNRGTHSINGNRGLSQCVCDERGGRAHMGARYSVCSSVYAVCCTVWHCVSVCCSVLQCVAVCNSVLQCVAECCSVLKSDVVCYKVLQCVAVCCKSWYEWAHSTIFEKSSSAFSLFVLFLFVGPSFTEILP